MGSQHNTTAMPTFTVPLKNIKIGDNAEQFRISNKFSHISPSAITLKDSVETLC